MTAKNIPYGKQYIDNADIDLVSKSLKSNLITTGNFVKDYESKIKSFLNCQFVTACNSGTAGLDLAVRSLEISKYDNVIIPSVNFVASLNVLSNIGAKIYLADVDSLTGQITPKTLLECIKKNKLKKIKLVVTMYLGGHPLNILEFANLKKKFKFFLLEDACHAFGAYYKYNKKKYMVGSCRHSDISVFSTHPIKSFTTGEGGLVTTNNKKLFQKITIMRSHGILRSKKNTKKNGSWFYNVICSGFNYRISDINCALGISQLKKIKLFLKKRKKISDLYLSKINEYKSIIKIINFKDLDIFSSNHLILGNINFKKYNLCKKKLFKYFAKHKIFPQVNYIPLYKFSKYKHLSKNLPGAEKYYSNVFSLPIYFSMTERDVTKVCNLLKKFIKNNFYKLNKKNFKN